MAQDPKFSKDSLYLKILDKSGEYSKTVQNCNFIKIKPLDEFF